MGIASPGIGSNLDVNSIIGTLMEIEKRPLLFIDQKEAGFQAKLSAYGSLKSSLSAFQTAVKGLSDVSKYQNLIATPANTALFTASADATANPGSYSIETTKLAARQKLVAGGQANTSDAIGTGTITFDFGTISGGTFDSGTGKYTGATFTSNGAGASTVTIDSTNHSLSGIRDAINAAKIGVTATIVNDGSASNPYRLSLTSDNIGLKNSIKISVTGDAALSNLLAQDPAGTQNLSETVTAADAAFKVDGVSITKSSNTVSDVIQGVTLNLLSTNSGSPSSLNITQDKTTVTGSVGSFVAAYNEVRAAIDELTAYNAATQEAAILQGDTATLAIGTKINRILNASVTALSGALTTMSDVGISFQEDGTLDLDSAKLQTAIDKHYNDIPGIFVAQGKPSDSLIQYVSATDKTDPGNYAVSITTLATQGKSVASTAAGLTITAGVNDTINLTVDDTTGSITLAAGTYASAAALATEVQAKVNGLSAFSNAGVSVTVSESAGVLTMTSSGYGSSSKVTVTGGNGETNLMGATQTETPGVNVAGTINGAASTGFGQFLTVSTGNVAEGLKIKVIGGATGARGTLAYSEGFAFQLEALTSEILGTTGTIQSRTDGINASIDDLNDQRDKINTRMVDIEARYRKQFASLDILLSNFQASSDFLTQQLASLANIPKTGKK
ncbi:MAG: flagellar filament capping protein FliD [Nitrospiria bacterium]